MKRLFSAILLSVSVTLLVIVLPGMPRAEASVLHGLPVLMFHYVSDPPDPSDISRTTLSVSPARFAEEMKWLKDNGYVTITPEDMVNGKPRAPHSVLLTFDDGYEDAYTNAFPVLKANGLVGTFFIITDWIDQNRPGYLTWSQVKEMAAAGMSIQAHTLNHQALAGHPADWQQNEIVGSMDAIQKNLGTRPRFLAYPFGSYDRTTIKVATQVGLAAAFTTRNGTVYSIAGNALVLPRLRMRYSMTLTEFASLLIRTTA